MNDSPVPINSCITEKIIHFVDLDSISDIVKDLDLIKFLAIRSAKHHNPLYKIILHCNYEPAGPFWDKIKSFTVADRIDSKKMECVSKMVRLEHKADFLRLSILKQSGGIYLDTDIITVKKFDQLLTNKVVMGKEQRSIDGPVLGLCNAVIIAPKNAAFISHWLECYQNFHNDQWGEFSVETPWRLAQSNPDLIDLEPVTSFFWPNGWPEGLIDLFEVKQDYPDAYTLHLWRSAAKDYLSKLTVEKIAHRNTSFTSAVKHLTRDCISEADRKMVQKDNCRNGPMLRSQL